MEQDDFFRVRLVDGTRYLAVLLHEHLCNDIVRRVVLVGILIRRFLNGHQLRFLVAYSCLVAVEGGLANCFGPRLSLSIK